MLHRMKMARSVFYYHMSHMDDSDGYDRIRERIKQIYNKNHGRYGYRRICMELRNEDIVINHKTVQKLMNLMGLKAKTKKRHYHSYKGEIGKIAPNVLERDFYADRPNQKWATDVTQVCINDRKLYLSPKLGDGHLYAQEGSWEVSTTRWSYTALRSRLALSACYVPEDA